MIVREVLCLTAECSAEVFIGLSGWETINGFSAQDYPVWAGAVDGTHIPIIAVRHDPSSYYSLKGWHSVVPEAVVDHNCW